jgi:hypothetical protein
VLIRLFHVCGYNFKLLSYCWNGTAHIRHLCRKITILSCCRCQKFSIIEKVNDIHRHYFKNRQLNEMYRLLVCQLNSVSGCFRKGTQKKQALITGTKQSKQANKADGLTRWAGWQGSQGCLNCFQACFVPTTSALLLLDWMFHKLIFVEQSTFLRYLLWHLLIDNNVNYKGPSYETLYGRKLLLFIISWNVCSWQAFPA